ncbi:hypothetical protein PO909_026841 [Leuciscus waleckii]
MDGPHGKDLGMEGGLEQRIEQNEVHKGSRESNRVNMDHEGQRNIKRRVDFLKEAMVVIDLRDNTEVKAEDIIKAVTQKIGFGKLLAVRPKHGREYELTLEGVDVCDVLVDGMEIKGDEVIEDKLKFWGVTPMMKIRRRVYPGTNIADGTRYVKVKFPKENSKAKFETADGTQYFRLIHDGQEKLCRMCMQPGHIIRDCPDFKCFECYEQGHFAKDCKADKCPDCKKAFMRCDCESEHEEVINDETENGEYEHNMEMMDTVNNGEEEDVTVVDNENSKGHEQEKGGDKELGRGEGDEMEGIMEEVLQHVSNKLLFRRRRRRHQGCTSALHRSHGHPSYAGRCTGAPGFSSRPYTGQIYPALNKTPRPVFAAPGKTPFFFPGFLLPLGRSDNPTYREMDLIAQDDPQAEQSLQGPKVACPVTTVVFPHRIRIASSIKTQQQAFSEPGPHTGFRHDTPASR